jgi:alpha-glucoside transport system substrate-binding protein
VKRRRSLIASAVALAVLAAGLTATAISAKPTKHSANSIEVFSLWGGSEKDAFTKVTEAFTKQTGIGVKYTSARDFIPAIRTRLAAGDPPDIAIVPRPGNLATLAREGVLKQLSGLGFTSANMKQNYGGAWISLGTVDGKLYGLPAKANSKSVIWYKPASFAKYHFKVPKTWDQLVKITKAYKAKGLTPWALGCGPGPSSWTLTDWFENIYVRTAGPAKYQALFSGKLKFTDSSVVKALQVMTSILNNTYVAGGIQGALGLSYTDGMARVFGKSGANAQMYMEGGFMGGIAIGQINPSLKPGKTIDDFPWPSIVPKYGSPLIGGGDLAVAFKDSPEIRQFLKYISSPAAGAIWVSTGAIVSPNKRVPASAYPNLLVRKEAHQVATAKVFRFDGSDQLPGAFGDTWGSALQNVIQKPTTGNINKILSTFQGQIAGKFGS